MKPAPDCLANRVLIFEIPLNKAYATVSGIFHDFGYVFVVVF